MMRRVYDPKNNRPPWWSWEPNVERQYAHVRWLYRPWWTWQPYMAPPGLAGLALYAKAAAARVVLSNAYLRRLP